MAKEQRGHSGSTPPIYQLGSMAFQNSEAPTMYTPRVEDYISFTVKAVSDLPDPVLAKDAIVLVDDGTSRALFFSNGTSWQGLAIKKLTITGAVSGTGTLGASGDMVLDTIVVGPVLGAPTTVTIMPTTVKVRWSISNMQGYYPEGLRFTLFYRVVGGSSWITVGTLPFDGDNRMELTISGLTAATNYEMYVGVVDVYSAFTSSSTTSTFTTNSFTADTDSEVRLIGPNSDYNLVTRPGYSRGNLPVPTPFPAWFNARKTYSQQAGQNNWKRAQGVLSYRPFALPLRSFNRNLVTITKFDRMSPVVGDSMLLKTESGLITRNVAATRSYTTTERRQSAVFQGSPYSVGMGWQGSSWRQHSLTLSAVRVNATVVRYGSFIYVIGGGGSAASSATRMSGDMLTLGPYGGLLRSDMFVGTTYGGLPEIRDGAAGVVIGDYIYLIGGMKSGDTPHNTIIRNKPDAYGNLGVWETVAATLTTAVGYAGVEVVGDEIFILGGQTSATTWTSEVQQLFIQDDGTLEVKSAKLNQLPEAMSHFKTFFYKGRLYTVGGKTGSNTATANCYCAELSPAGEILMSWTVAGTLDTPQHDVGLYVADGDVVVFGGMVGATKITSHYYMTINATGLFSSRIATDLGVWNRQQSQIVTTGGMLLSLSTHADTGLTIAFKHINGHVFTDRYVVEQELVWDYPVDSPVVAVYRNSLKFAITNDATYPTSTLGNGDYDHDQHDIGVPVYDRGVAMATGHTLSRSAMATIGGYIWSFGGLSGSTPTDLIYRGTPPTDYSDFSTWVAATAKLPRPVYQAEVWSNGQACWVMGGISTNGHRLNSITLLTPSSATNDITSHTLRGVLPKPMTGFGLVSHGSWLYLIGGEAMESSGSETTATVAVGATSWAIPGGVRLLRVVGKGVDGTSGAAGANTTFTYGGVTYTCPGGAIGTAAVARTVYIWANPDVGTSMSTTVPTGGSITVYHTSAVSAMNTTIYRCRILRSNGELATTTADGVASLSWEVAGSLPAGYERSYFKPIVHNDRMWIVGGVSNVAATSFPATIISAPITETTGTIGTWRTDVSNGSWTVGAYYGMYRYGGRATFIGGRNGSSVIKEIRHLNLDVSPPTMTWGCTTDLTDTAGVQPFVTVTLGAARVLNNGTSGYMFGAHGTQYGPTARPNLSRSNITLPIGYSMSGDTIDVEFDYTTIDAAYLNFGVKVNENDTVIGFNLRLWT